MVLQVRDDLLAGVGPSPIPRGWRRVLADECAKPYYRALQAFLGRERRRHAVYPAEGDVFAAFALTPHARVRVVLLGQDPYPGPGQAHGLCFSVPPGIAPPPSLANIFQELQADIGCRLPRCGSLVPWARQGVLLLNAVLTVRAHRPGSHRRRGWEPFTDAVIRAVSAGPDPIVFALWGREAQRKRALVDPERHTVIASAHPSPMSARRGFFGSRPFSRINAALRAAGRAGIDWRLSDR